MKTIAIIGMICMGSFVGVGTAIAQTTTKPEAEKHEGRGHHGGRHHHRHFFRLFHRHHHHGKHGHHGEHKNKEDKAPAKAEN